MSTQTTISTGFNVDWKRILFLSIGLILFIVVNFSPPWPDAIDPTGKHFVLSQQAKGALAVFLLGGTWWVFEVVPIGVTSLFMGILQAVFLPACKNCLPADV